MRALDRRRTGKMEYNENIDICSGRHGGAETSQEAFEGIRAGLPAARARVFSVIVGAGLIGLTSQEIADSLGVGVNVISGRVTELLKAGYVIDSGKRRKTRSGFNARVVVASDD